MLTCIHMQLCATFVPLALIYYCIYITDSTDFNFTHKIMFKCFVQKLCSEVCCDDHIKKLTQ